MTVFRATAIAVLASYSVGFSHGFSGCSVVSRPGVATSSSALSMESNSDRRAFLTESVFALTAGLGATVNPSTASARVYLDPAMYGDQELRVSAVDSLRESVRRALLQKPSLTPYFLELALLDSLSYSAETNEGGPDGSIIKAVMASKDTDAHTKSLQECAAVLLESKKNLKKLSSITIADAVALAGAEAVNAVGGPVLPTQLGRTEAAAKAPIPSSMPPLNLFTGDAGDDAVAEAFRSSGLTEREMTALLGCLLSVDSIEKATPEGDWRASSKPKFREAGKIGRMSDFKKLTDEDIEAELAKDGADDEESYTVSGDDGWYIADTFGTADSRFGKSLTDKKPELSTAFKNMAKTSASSTQYSWVSGFLLSKDLPTAQQWVNKYGSKPLLYEKDLKVAYNAVTQLGAEFTGGKYESLLKNKKRKTLNDDELDFLR
eukprot:CAMPEP_0172529538 /NCGR_PEP_ID=MMETSP1067-20121228/3600_1 /TAXON_ID=265564 ORGANISM="Thalassiosira punctigera, Strain Tpunct2005C2" /NCGR_SAMPLE_ID=MMETSP1067 /ASSEMBLY_ACC=CAM_ASM_000444 /LENGTH=433 /DNA_ID=CAMNT_0013313607 /DNA_START=150 /DNA_END=1451 /DNA_ORIENTATION=+